MDLSGAVGPPPYRLRVSDRARHVRLQVRPREGLVVVVPRRFDRSRLPELLAARAAWIARALERVGIADEEEALPHHLALPGLGESYAVEYLPAGSTARAALREGRVRVAAPDEEGAAEALRRFVTRRARVGLAAELAALAAARGAEVQAVSVRAQRTRWASCSATGRVSLNRNLAFLPPPLVATVLLHELCHLEELNHSPRFWALLSAAVPELDLRRAELAAAWRHVPRWAR
ncbi:MAG TPA: YgjP-like metallopeptidase domain-containing protein [Acidimicrobiales bacterium]|nr:YgjP-like metallopeptidase domain-containing protein [Acidimicrobiales bacterium]